MSDLDEEEPQKESFQSGLIRYGKKLALYSLILSFVATAASNSASAYPSTVPELIMPFIFNTIGFAVGIIMVAFLWAFMIKPLINKDSDISQ